jgi:hypothetical protein
MRNPKTTRAISGLAIHAANDGCYSSVFVVFDRWMTPDYERPRGLKPAARGDANSCMLTLGTEHL